MSIWLAMGQSSGYVNSSVQEVGEISHTGLLREGWKEDSQLPMVSGTGFGIFFLF